jgi:TetR/AcrR family transcriptional regulator, transcriptional repressor for nem operon
MGSVGEREGGSNGTRARALDVAEELAQIRGFNALSYREIAARLGVTSASLHYHFPAKADLGEALIGRYTESFGRQLQRIAHDTPSAPDRLAAYTTLYSGVLHTGRMCLCGMLAAEFQTLSEEMRNAVLRFLELNEGWLENVLEQGRRSEEIAFEGPARETGRALLAALEGAMLLARADGDESSFDHTARRLLQAMAEPCEAPSA